MYEGVLSLISFEVDSAPEDPGISSPHRPDDQRGGVSLRVEDPSLGTNCDSRCLQDYHEKTFPYYGPPTTTFS